MNFTDIKSLTKFYIAEITDRKLPDSIFEIIINQGVLDVAVKLGALPATGYFDSEAGIGEYSLSAKLTRYLSIDKEGIWWKNGSEWEELYPRTKKYLDNKLPNWRSDSDGSPQRYALNGDTFIPHPKPTSTATDAFLVNFIQRPPIMTEDGHFPFPVGATQSGTERSDLSILSDTIILYSEWMILGSLKKRQEAFEKRNEYFEDLLIKQKFINRRRDIEYSDQVKLQGPKVNG